MLYETFNIPKNAYGQDFSTSRISDNIVLSLNPKFAFRKYPKKAPELKKLNPIKEKAEKRIEEILNNI